MLVFHCHLRTCKECWKSGDKRINQEVERRRKGQELEEEEPYQDEDDHDFDLSTEEEDFEAMHPSRPTTPELDLNPEQMPRWLFGMEVVGDVTKACEPVKLEKIWKDYRARRGKTDWYSIEGKSLVPKRIWYSHFIFVS